MHIHVTFSRAGHPPFQGAGGPTNSKIEALSVLAGLVNDALKHGPWDELDVRMCECAEWEGTSDDR